MKLALVVSLCIMLILTASVVHAQEELYCEEGERRLCGIDTGVCESGRAVCKNGEWVECKGLKKPVSEADICGNGIDDNCNGEVDENCFPWLSFILVGLGIFFIGIGLYYMQKDRGGGRIISEDLAKD